VRSDRRGSGTPMALILLQRFERESSCHVATREHPSNPPFNTCTRQSERLSSLHHGELIGEPLHGPIPCGSPAAADAALAFMTEPPGLRFVVAISQLLDAVQCGVASGARLTSPSWTRIERRSSSRCRDTMDMCPDRGRYVRYSDIDDILEGKPNRTTVRARRGSAHGASAASPCRVVEHAAAHRISRGFLAAELDEQTARAGGALAFKALHARTWPSSQSRGSGARANGSLWSAEGGRPS
jgi:hypothetical protein